MSNRKISATQNSAKREGRKGKNARGKCAKGMCAKGTYTVEASIIIPIFLFMAATAMKTGLIVYQETGQVQEQEAQEDFDAVSYFYQVSGVSKITDLLKKGS